MNVLMRFKSESQSERDKTDVVTELRARMLDALRVRAHEAY